MRTERVVADRADERDAPPEPCRVDLLESLFLALIALAIVKPPGHRDHPGRRDARHAGRDRPTPDESIRVDDADGRRGRRRLGVLGLYLSYWLDVASGATIVLVQTGLFLVVLALGPRSGLIAARRARRATSDPDSRGATPAA